MQRCPSRHRSVGHAHSSTSGGGQGQGPYEPRPPNPNSGLASPHRLSPSPRSPRNPRDEGPTPPVSSVTLAPPQTQSPLPPSRDLSAASDGRFWTMPYGHPTRCSNARSRWWEWGGHRSGGQRPDSVSGSDLLSSTLVRGQAEPAGRQGSAHLQPQVTRNGCHVRGAGKAVRLSGHERSEPGGSHVCLWGPPALEPLHLGPSSQEVPVGTGHQNTQAGIQ